MPDFLTQPADDHVALAICFGAVLVSGLVMHFSHHVGRLTGAIRLHETPHHTGMVFPEAQPAQLRQPAEPATHERAA